jgi:division protein CdvB (Snf7/Vps24/ESCRT-III family)
LLKDTLREWDREDQKPLLTRLKGKVLRSRPLRERIIFCIYRLRIQKDRLEIVILKLKRRDGEVFGKCVEAKMRKDEARASIYAEERHEVRKLFKIVCHCKLRIEQAMLRLETIEIFSGLAASVIIPMSIIKEIRSKLAGILPSVSSQIGEVASELEDIVVVAGRAEPSNVEVSSLTDEANLILEQAQAIVEAKTKEVFPDLLDEQVPQPDRELEPA